MGYDPKNDPTGRRDDIKMLKTEGLTHKDPKVRATAKRSLDKIKAQEADPWTRSARMALTKATAEGDMDKHRDVAEEMNTREKRGTVGVFIVPKLADSKKIHLICNNCGERVYRVKNGLCVPCYNEKG